MRGEAIGAEGAKIGGAFVGRDRELEELRVLLDDALTGRETIALVSGEAGIGKSRLAGEFASLAADRGARVLWGRSWEGEGAPAYWIWVQVLRSYIVGCPADELAEQLGQGAGYVVQLVPEIADRIGPTTPPPSLSDPDHARFALFDAMSRFLRAGAYARPLVIILDDLHWAWPASLTFLEFLAQGRGDAPLFVLGAYREPEAGADPNLARLLGDLGRHGRHLRIGGLDRAHLAELIEAAFGEFPSEETVRSIHSITGGNPFFVDEVVRLLVTQGKTLASDVVPALPASVRETIRRRIGLLSPQARDALRLASVVGDDFTLAVLERAGDRAREDIVGGLQEATKQGLLNSGPAALGSYGFSHALVREVLYEDLPPVERARTHALIGRALERVYGAAAERHVDELAHHYTRAAIGGETAKGVHYATLAGDRAAGQLAYEEAAQSYQRALHVLELGEPDAAGRCDLLVRRGDALWRAGAVDAARDLFLEAAGIARAIADSDLLARSALGYGVGLGGEGLTFRADQTLIGLLEEALATIGNDEGDLRVRLVSRLAAELYFTDQVERRVALAAEALASARRIGDPAIQLVATYSSQWALLNPDTVMERLGVADEIISLATQTGDREMLYWGHRSRFAANAELGDMRAAAVGIEACSRLAEELRMPLYAWHMATWRAGETLTHGDLARAEEESAQAAAIAGPGHGEFALIVYGAQLAVIRWLQGRFAELEPAVRDFSEQYPWIAGWRVAMPCMYAEAGRLDEAWESFERSAVAEFRDLPWDASWLPAMWVLALPCAHLDDARRAAMLYEMLRPYADRTVVVAAIGVNFGSASLPLGVLAATMRRWDDAFRHFHDARRRNDDIGHRPMNVLLLREVAAAHLARGAPGDVSRGLALLDEAEHAMQTEGLPGLLPRLHALRAKHSAGVRHPAEFRFDGDAWTITWGARTIRLPRRKGLRYLSLLLANPGTPLFALDLVVLAEMPVPSAGASERATGAGLAGRSGSAQAVLDPAAKAAYRRRLAELEQEMEEAKAWGDDERAASARSEREAITDQLAKAVGLGGRDRPGASDAERARLNVTRAIHTAVDLIERDHAELGRHLREAVSTGSFCVYEPAAQPSWTL